MGNVGVLNEDDSRVRSCTTVRKPYSHYACRSGGVSLTGTLVIPLILIYVMRKTMRVSRTMMLGSLLLAACGSAPEEAVFLTTLGQDTLVVESLIRTQDRFEGTMIHRVPRTTRYTYRGTLDAATQRVRSFEGTMTFPGDTGRPPADFGMSFEDTAVVSTWRRGDRPDTARLTTRRGAAPTILQGFALYEQLTRQAAAQGGDSVAIDVVGIASRRVFPNAIVRQGNDSVSYSLFGKPLMLHVDHEGKLLGADGGRTTQQTITVRLPAVDLAGIQSSFLAAEERGWSLSKRDTTTGAIGGAALWVDYSRPMRRGRDIFGQVVRFDEVWRTGANAATQFRTSRDLSVGGRVLPAGFYTLWTIPTEGGATLIVNRETGQWGTAYDSSQDIIRIPLEVEALDEPVERFEIGVEEVGPREGALTFSWDRSRWRLRFTVR